MSKWKVKAKQGTRVTTTTVVTPNRAAAEEYTKFLLRQRSSQPVEILETTEKTKKKKP
jgi:hypothetical protein